MSFSWRQILGLRQAFTCPGGLQKVRMEQLITLSSTSRSHIHQIQQRQHLSEGKFLCCQISLFISQKYLFCIVHSFRFYKISVIVIFKCFNILQLQLRKEVQPYVTTCQRLHGDCSLYIKVLIVVRSQSDFSSLHTLVESIDIWLENNFLQR